MAELGESWRHSAKITPKKYRDAALEGDGHICFLVFTAAGPRYIGELYTAGFPDFILSRRIVRQRGTPATPAIL